MPERDAVAVAAEQTARQLTELLRSSHHVSADVHLLASGHALISVWHGLVARTDGRAIWWTAPAAAIPGRDRPLLVLTFTAQGAAARLTKHRAALRADIVARIRAGTAGTLADLYLEEMTSHAAPV
ncbi:hypothetical protein [Planomonospora parontospora]|uniref:hypothetical protein n=1 Tax=Planomonospora parontospora TaxID=58119 RepID=UPI0016717EA5|nr:hypothetical protein [Planomonospora parontospora]GGL41218.1 hypothetical protein GCM10014719_48080 [Planomonospora parontospora subsp. antibiotica]GII17937.1 hypothetical protein Ppa05_46630 [Planomonospora parontospora subsp. antibiotica]